MGKISSIGLCLVLMFLSCNPDKNKVSSQLEGIINSVQDHEGYDELEFPLGVFTEIYYQKEADFAADKLKELNALNPDLLKETELISYELLKFVLQNRIDFYAFDMYLNPLLSDSGFHSNLVYMVRPLTNYQQTKSYLNKLNDIPRFVDEHFVILQKGLEKGISQPEIIFKGYESTYDAHIIADVEESCFF
jgi:uncharacterized protein (DUF885 family)